MTRRRTWKFCSLPDLDDVRRLDSCRGSAAGSWQNYTIVLGNANGLETDMPWTELRHWFSYAGVRMPEMGTCDAPSWVIYHEGPPREWPHGPLLSWESLDSPNTQSDQEPTP